MPSLLNTYQDQNYYDGMEIIKLRRENERLREALQAVSDFYGWNGDGPLGEAGNKVRKALMSSK